LLGVKAHLNGRIKRMFFTMRFSNRFAGYGRLAMT